jgi:rhodanese-related sulfurtransferase
MSTNGDRSETGPRELEVAPREVAEWLEQGREFALVDVREAYERDAGHIAGSAHIELVELPARAAEIEAARQVVFYCRVGSRSAMAAAAFRASGYDAYSMRGGLVQWVHEGRDISPKDGYVANH